MTTENPGKYQLADKLIYNIIIIIMSFRSSFYLSVSYLEDYLIKITFIRHTRGQLFDVTTVLAVETQLAGRSVITTLASDSASHLAALGWFVELSIVEGVSSKKLTSNIKCIYV